MVVTRMTNPHGPSRSESVFDSAETMDSNNQQTFRRLPIRRFKRFNNVFSPPIIINDVKVIKILCWPHLEISVQN